MTQPIVVDKAYTIRKKIGSGGMADVFLVEVDLGHFDVSTLFAYTQVQAEGHMARRRKAEELAATLHGKKLDPATMFAVLSAQHIPVPQTVAALKLARSAANRERFEAEWKNLLCLNHPNIIAVYGGGLLQERPYYVMELLQGILPPAEIASTLTIRDKLQVLIDAGTGLQFLHENGIIHRDVKPTNIVTVRASDGTLQTRITDLGLAKNLAENLGLTHANMILGSPSYMAPEQIEASSDVDHRADVYSLGATMYELVTGRPPYDERETSYQVIIAVSTGVSPEPPDAIVPDLPDPVTQIIQTAMEPDPADRYQSVEEMISDLRTYLTQEAKSYTTSIRFAEADKGQSSARIGRGFYLFEEMLKTRAPERLVEEEEAPPLPEDIEAYRLLAVCRKHASHTVFKRCADQMSMEYIQCQAPREAEASLSSHQIDFATLEYARHDQAILRLCEKLRSRRVPFLLFGNDLSRSDILLASRLGAASVMLNPINEKKFREKVLQSLDAAATPEADGQADMTAINFKGKNSPAERARILAKTAPKLLVLPHAASKVISICNDPNASADDLAMPIQSDSAVAAMVLRRANSAALAASRRISHIRDAVVRIGRKETKQLAVTMAVYKLFDKQEKSFGFNRYMYWVHALGAGIAAKMLAERLRHIDEQSAFLAGLLHDLGKIIFDDHLNRDYHDVLERAGHDGLRVCKAEQDRFMMDHAFMGARVGERWKLPTEITDAIENHHRVINPTAQTDEVSLALLAAMGNAIIKAVGAGHSGDFLVEDIPHETWRLVLPSTGAATEYAKLLRTELGEFADMLGIDSKQSRFDKKMPVREETIGIVDVGLSPLLVFFFAARGYKTRLIDWEEFRNGRCDVACDGREMPDEARNDLRSDECFFNRRAFVLGNEPADLPVDSTHLIAPAHDFFQLEQVVGKVYESAGNTSR